MGGIPNKRGGALRIGFGYDIHPLVAGRPLIMGGINIPFEKGLDGHSDADVLCHAVADALLGAAALGDIGEHFPDTDPAYKDARSIDLLSRVGTLLHEAGYTVGNVDSTVVAEAPKLLPYREEIQKAIADALAINKQKVSVKAKTHEGFGPMGRGEAIAAYAVVSIEATA
jgi:2-C-methyl-D-erythritol 2,4-cyclodiphosphate synthase